MKKLIVFIVLFVILCSAVVLWRCPMKYKDLISEKSKAYNLSPSLVASVIKCESGYRKDAVSKTGAKGLMQLTDTTYSWLCEIRGTEESDVFVPETNIDFGCYYLALLIQRFGDTQTALAAYNGGPTAVAEWLENKEYSADGVHLDRAPKTQTDIYMHKVPFFETVYKILYFWEE